MRPKPAPRTRRSSSGRSPWRPRSQRLEEAGAELEARALALSAERDDTESSRRCVCAPPSWPAKRQLDADVLALDRLRREVRDADDGVSALRARAPTSTRRSSRTASGRARGRSRDCGRTRRRPRHRRERPHASGGLLSRDGSGHDRRGRSLKVDELERRGEATPDSRVIGADEPEEVASDEGDVARPPPTPMSPGRPARALSAEEAIGTLRAKIDRLGPVNMMAIEQFDELETRHTFLTHAAQGSARFHRADERGDQAHRRNDAPAVRRGVRGHQPELPGNVQHAVWRWSRGPDAARRERSARERHRNHRAAARASVCRASSCCRAARRRSPPSR